MINSKNVKIKDFKYIIKQPSAIKALALSGLAQRLQNAMNSLAAGSGNFDEDKLEEDLNKLLKNNDHIKIVTGISKNMLTTARMITSDEELPSNISDLGDLIGQALNFMFAVDEEVPIGEGVEEAEGGK